MSQDFRLGDARTALTSVVREEAGRLTASLMRWLGDFALAEEVVQDSLLIALERWPTEGIPDRPGAWLWTVARRLALNRIDRDQRYRSKLAELEPPEPPSEPDDRLPLLFLCCHPALGIEAQIALTLRAICGLTTVEIASAFVTSDATVAQRIVRARRKIGEAAIPYVVPAGDALAERLNGVLSVLYLMLALGPSPVVRLNRAVALREVAGPEAAFAEVTTLADDLDGYYLLHAVRGDLLIDVGRREDATAAHQRALMLAKNRAERALIRAKLSGLKTGDTSKDR